MMDWITYIGIPLLGIPLLLMATNNQTATKFEAQTATKFEAQLNQDQTWTLNGDIHAALSIDIDAPYMCLVQQLAKFPPENNPNPNNSKYMTVADAVRVVCSDFRVRECFPDKCFKEMS